MEQHVKIINPERVTKAMNDMECGKTHVAEISGEDFEMKAFDIDPPEGFQAPDKFPFCCPQHEHIYQTTKTWYDKFPNCCPYHKKLNSASWFNKSDYDYVLNKVSYQLVYTGRMINLKLDNEDWYDDITEYIEHNYASFGQLPTGFGPAPGLKEYLGVVRQEFKEPTMEKLVNAPEKTKRLLQFVDTYYSRQAKAKVDFNQLITTYKNWLKIFPFETIYFKQLKAYFSSQLPILKGKPLANRYSKTAKITFKTQSELIEWLLATTKILLQSINSADLVKNNFISDAKKHAIELMGEEHRIRQDELFTEFQKGEIQYVNVLKKWIKNEKTYFKGLIPYIKPLNQTPKLQYPPVNEDVFEDLITDLFNAQHPEARFERFGKRGNHQKGIDILSTVRKEAIQCKKKDGSRKVSVIKAELKKEFEADIQSAMELNVEIDLLIFASTFENNTGLEEHLQEIKKKLKPKFNVMYIGWNTISGSLHQYSSLVDKYFGK